MTTNDAGLLELFSQKDFIYLILGVPLFFLWGRRKICSSYRWLISWSIWETDKKIVAQPFFYLFSRMSKSLHFTIVWETSCLTENLGIEYKPNDRGERIWEKAVWLTMHVPFYTYLMLVTLVQVPVCISKIGDQISLSA